MEIGCGCTPPAACAIIGVVIPPKGSKKEDLVSVPYILYPNPLTDEPNAHWARLISKGKIELEQVIDRMILQRGAVGTRAEVLGILEDFYRALEDLLAEGYILRLPNGTYRLAVRGIFQGAGDTFDPARHKIVVCIAPSKRLRCGVPERVRLIKERRRVSVPRPEAYFDAASGSTDDRLTPQDIGRVSGRGLRFDPADPKQGVFLRHTDAGEETRATSYSEVAPAVVHFLVPPLAPGCYQLIVRTRVGEEEDLYSGLLEQELRVS